MNKRKIFSTLIVLACCALAASAVFAQQGRYANVYSRSQVENFVAQLENSSDVFYNDFRREVNNSNLNGSTKRTYNNYAEQFENAVDRLRNRFNSNDAWWESRNEVQNMVNNGRNLNTTMNAAAFRRKIENQWNRLRNDVNKLADTYDLPGLNGGGWNGGPWNPGGGGGGGNTRPPGWAVGTWYWVQGSNRSFTIDANGVVTEYSNGGTNTGSYRRGSIYLNGNQSTVTRNGSGIRTYNMSTGETSDYRRENLGGDPGPGPGGPISRPPSWAVGTWVWVQGYDRRFSIDSNGRVTEYTGGGTNYGSYYNGVMTLNGSNSTITRTRNGIRTYNQSTGETSDYRRQ
jgi:hypothetical protein